MTYVLPFFVDDVTNAFTSLDFKALYKLYYYYGRPM